MKFVIQHGAIATDSSNGETTSSPMIRIGLNYPIVRLPRVMTAQIQELLILLSNKLSRIISCTQINLTSLNITIIGSDAQRLSELKAIETDISVAGIDTIVSKVKQAYSKINTEEDAERHIEPDSLETDISVAGINTIVSKVKETYNKTKPSALSLSSSRFFAMQPKFWITHYNHEGRQLHITLESKLKDFASLLDTAEIFQTNSCAGSFIDDGIHNSRSPKVHETSKVTLLLITNEHYQEDKVKKLIHTEFNELMTPDALYFDSSQNSDSELDIKF